MNSSVAIIGFDFGHGKTALARMFSGANSEPEIVEINNQRIIITAIAYNRETNFVCIGEDAFFKSQVQVQEFYICFKHKPFKNTNEQEIFTFFVKELYRQLLGSQQNVPNITQHFCIGHPSGWSEKEVNKYKEIIQSCFTNDEKIELIPESRAALIHTISTNRFTVNRIQQGILVIDIGSSTTDLTFISDKYSQDYGENRYDLGGSIIEKELLKKALKLHDRCEDIKNNSYYLNRCELECRKTKEKYFSTRHYMDFPDEEFTGSMVIFSDDIEFTPRFNGRVIEEIINTKLSELDNQSWKEAFEEQLNIAKKEITKVVQVVQFGGILITGGGSKMNFVKEICHSVFPNSEFPGLEISSDTDPELCIARGLARWGNISIIRTESQNKIKLYLDNNLQIFVDGIYPKLLNAISQSLENSFIEEVLQPTLRRTKYHDLGNINLLSEPEFKKWADKSFTNEIVPIIKPYVETILKEMQTNIINILKELEMPVIDIFEIPQLDLYRFQTMLNDFKFDHSIKTIPTSIILSAIIVDLTLAIISGGLFIALPIPTPGILTLLFLNLYRGKKLIADKDISQIVDKFKLKGEFRKTINNELNNQISSTKLAQSLRTEIDKTLNTKIEFIQMLLAAEN